MDGKIKGWYGKMANGMFVSVYIDDAGINFCVYENATGGKTGIPTHAIQLPFTTLDGEPTKEAVTQMAQGSKVVFGKVEVPEMARALALLTINTWMFCERE